ncbi:hypothetical protein CS062_16345 [Roseateles chitinivorans]|uniref:Uncharacterized protein n=1 Tax=Roseateles chitinivorans TaxID=2917965 RepID=A0A2G9C702_9BURK|nr:hypothetical protein [Roseateles chitinivorans]PIM52122.1 hypothetical protein CS062_16345 [Roseateles chitinivorans]
MSARYRSTCRHCWDPVDREGHDACAWCSLSPAERRRRRRRRRRQSLVAAVVLAILLIAALLSVPQA